MAADPLFVDTNILVYASQRQAPQHHQALRLLQKAEEAGTTLWISRQVLREYLAVVTRPQNGAAPLPIDVAVEDVRRFEANFEVADDGAHVTAELLDLLQRFQTGGRQVHDANVVATMLAYRIRRLLTFNVADFQRFSSVITVETAEPEPGT